MKQYANLHFHSTHSDGVYTPAALASMAKAEGYGAIVLTSHDTVTGIAECRAAVEVLGLSYIDAAELPTDPHACTHWAEPCTLGTQKLFLMS